MQTSGVLRPAIMLGVIALSSCPPSTVPSGPDASQAAPADLTTLPVLPDPCRSGKALPADSHYVAPGLCARLVMDGGLGGIRQITFAPNGDLFAVNNSGTIYKLHDANQDGAYQASEITTYARTGGNGNNCHIDAGYLYAGSPGGVMRWPWAPALDTGGAGQAVVINQPSDGGHPLHTVHVYDGWLYVHSGSVSNLPPPGLTDYDQNRSLVRRFDLRKFDPQQPFDWSNPAQGEVVADGLRNTVGFTRNAAGRIYGVVNGMDEVTYSYATLRVTTRYDNPGEQVVLLDPARKRHYGYPFCYTAQGILKDPSNPAAGVIPAGTQVRNDSYQTGAGLTVTDAWCASHSDPPATFIQAHSAPLDIAFYDGPLGALPARWRGGAFVSLHGSWDRRDPDGTNVSTGHKVIWVPFRTDGSAALPQTSANPHGGFPPTVTTFPYEVVFGGGGPAGPRDGSWSFMSDNPVRPVGVAISPADGALYISSDVGGYIYRVGSQR